LTRRSTASASLRGKGYAYLDGKRINAKNRFGGHVGEEPQVFLFRNGQDWLAPSYAEWSFVE
jgi:hypothetical protein